MKVMIISIIVNALILTIFICEINKFGINIDSFELFCCISCSILNIIVGVVCNILAFKYDESFWIGEIYYIIGIMILMFLGSVGAVASFEK
jgi:hypothetical protein